MQRSVVQIWILHLHYQQIRKKVSKINFYFKHSNFFTAWNQSQFELKWEKGILFPAQLSHVFPLIFHRKQL